MFATLYPSAVGRHFYFLISLPYTPSMDADGVGAAAAIPAPAAPPPQPQPATPEELELARYGAPPDTPLALVPKFLELARSKVPAVEFDATWGLRFAHQEGSSQFSRYGWLTKPSITSERHLAVQCRMWRRAPRAAAAAVRRATR